MDLAQIIAKWRKVVVRSRPIDRTHAENALASLYRYVGRAPPEAFAFYRSPDAALEDFPRWRDRIGRVATVYWEHSLPLCDPHAAFRGGRASWAKIALRRTPTIEEGVLTGDVIDATRNAIEQELGETWCDAVQSELLDRHEEIFFDDLQAKLDREDPTLQLRPHEFVSLGPMGWLATEVACVNAFGLHVDQRHASTLSNLLRHCSIVYAFQRLCVVCDRPQRIDPTADTLVVTFRDGSRIETATK